MFYKESCSKFPILPDSMVKMDLQFLLTSGRLGLNVCTSKNFPSFQSAMLNAKLLLHVVVNYSCTLPAGVSHISCWQKPASVLWRCCGCLDFPQTRNRFPPLFLTPHHREVHFFVLNFALNLTCFHWNGGERTDGCTYSPQVKLCYSRNPSHTLHTDLPTCPASGFKGKR